MQLRDINTSTACANGKRFITTKGYEFTIKGQATKVKKCSPHDYCYFFLEFDDVGFGAYTRTADYASIRNGTVKNKLSPTYLGKGCVGVGKHLMFLNGRKSKEYVLWSSMMTRCYSINTHKTHKTYKGCTVARRWLNFQNFCEDLPNLKGYTEWIKGISKVVLDKDIIVKGNKVYSNSTCMFVSNKENCQTGNRKPCTTGKTYTATNKTGTVYEFTNISSFGTQHGINGANIGKCLNGTRKSCKGFTFAIKHVNE